MLAKKPQKSQQRQAQNGGMLALDLVEELHAEPFQPVGADAVQARLALRGEIGVQKRVLKSRITSRGRAT